MPQSILSSGEVERERHGTTYRRVRRDGAAPFDTGFSSAAASLRPYSGCYGCQLDRLCVVILEPIFSNRLELHLPGSWPAASKAPNQASWKVAQLYLKDTVGKLGSSVAYYWPSVFHRP